MRPCSICGGSVRLRHPGSGPGQLTAADLSPTLHRPGVHGDLFECERCGTVEQAGLPSGPELVELYRAMRDDHYLEEEAGRRATARWLLDLIEAHTDRGLLLDVGCGHGLLLDEGRSRGWRVLGLDPSAGARLHATGVLGLEVVDGTLGTLDGTAGPFEAIVLQDVLEHFDDPRDELLRCAQLLSPGGALCVVTPDPGSVTARLAGAGWWGYVPAHTFLLPRRTLRSVLAGTGLHPVLDVGLRRTFTLRYWMEGLAERGGPLGPLAAVGRRLPLMRHMTLSLGDERVVVARRAAAVARLEPSARFQRRPAGRAAAGGPR